MRTVEKRIEYENLFFCFAVAFSSIVGLLVQTFRLVIPNTYKLDTLLVYILLAYVFVKALPSLKGAFGFADLFLMIFGILVFCFSFLHKESMPSVTNTVLTDILIDCFILYLAAKTVRFTPKLLKYMRLAALVTIVNTVLNVYVFSAGALAEEYSQNEGYLLLTSMALIFVTLATEHKLIDFVLAVINLIAALLTGARGPFVLCVALLIISMFFIAKSKKNALLPILAISAIAVVVMFNLENILEYLLSKFGDFASTRTIERILDDSLFEDKARSTLYEKALAYINEHIFAGCGVVNDRAIMSGGLEARGSYPHNIFLEMMMQFGMVGGAFLSIILIVSIVKKYFILNCFEERIILVALVISGLAPLLVTGSYLEWQMFYALLGFLLRRRKVSFERSRNV